MEQFQTVKLTAERLIAPFCILLTSYVCYLLFLVVYNAYFHPLARFPGPFWWGATPIPYVWYQLNGRLPFVFSELHDKHGDVVRVLPYMLSFRDANAWRDIYQIRPKRKLLTKDPYVMSPGSEGAYNIITSFDPAEHARFRERLNPGFSTRAFRGQEPMVMAHVDELIEKLRAKCGSEEAQDMVKWPALLYFDIVADLIFGKKLGNVESEQPHPWLDGLFGSTMRLITYFNAARQFPHIIPFLKLFFPKDLMDQQIKHAAFTRDSVDARMQLKEDKASNSRDFMSYILPYDEATTHMSMAEIRSTYGTLMIAGSENVSTTASFTIYHLLKNPDTLRKATEEVRKTCKHDEDITFTSIGGMKYLSGVVHESMRLNPAAPTTQSRVVPEGGVAISGTLVPEGARVGAPPYCVNHHAEFFKDPESFLPERWTDDPRFSSDQPQAFHPFQLGPRACAGKSIALAEIQLLIAKILFHFDISLDESSSEWSKDMRIFHLWQLRPLLVHFSKHQG
ncbi:cytochrome P450 [Trichoderma evansii]